MPATPRRKLLDGLLLRGQVEKPSARVDHPVVDLVAVVQARVGQLLLLPMSRHKSATIMCGEPMAPIRLTAQV